MNTRSKTWLFSIVALILSMSFGRYFSPHLDMTMLAEVLRFRVQLEDVERFNCRPFLPSNMHIDPNHPVFEKTSSHLKEFLGSRFRVGDIDSLSIGVVTPSGITFAENYGRVKGNESVGDAASLTDSHSMYRIASVGKIFTVLEGMILAEKGLISWEDPVSKYLPALHYRTDALFGEYDPVDPLPITLLDLASHMSGLGRDWPPGDVVNWPYDMIGAGPPPTNGLAFPSHQSLYKAIEKYYLTSPPSTYPGYSNTGMALLGMSLTQAAGDEVHSFAELVKRDIFDPVGMLDSHFLATSDNKDRVVVPSIAPEVADQDFLDAMNPAAGQFSSLSDCLLLVRNLLNAGNKRPTSLVSKHTIRKWLRPVHSFEEDDSWTEVGIGWEIVKVKDSNRRPRKVYWKLGAMAGYHAALAIHPGSSYGIVVLMAGRYPDAAKITYDAFEIFQPYIDRVMTEQAKALYGGEWMSEDGQSSASVIVNRGTLVLKKYILNGRDTFKYFKPTPGAADLALRWMGRGEEFRVDVGIPFYNGQKHMGCYPYWVGQDLWGQRNGAALNMVYFSGKGDLRTLHAPAASVRMIRLPTS